MYYVLSLVVVLEIKLSLLPDHAFGTVFLLLNRPVITVTFFAYFNIAVHFAA